MSEVDPRSESRPRKEDEEPLKQTDGAATEDTSQDATLDEIELLQEKLEAKELSGPSLKKHEHPQARDAARPRQPRRE